MVPTATRFAAMWHRLSRLVASPHQRSEPAVKATWIAPPSTRFAAMWHRPSRFVALPCRRFGLRCFAARAMRIVPQLSRFRLKTPPLPTENRFEAIAYSAGKPLLLPSLAALAAGYVRPGTACAPLLLVVTAIAASKTTGCTKIYPPDAVARLRPVAESPISRLYGRRREAHASLRTRHVLPTGQTIPHQLCSIGPGNGKIWGMLRLFRGMRLADSGADQRAPEPARVIERHYVERVIGVADEFVGAQRRFEQHCQYEHAGLRPARR